MNMTVKLKPFQTPNYVIQEVPARPRQEGMIEAPKYALAELDAETLAGLCDQFRADVFKKAGVADPANNELSRKRA